MMHKQTRIAQKDHDLFTVEAKKTSFSAFNDKKWITRDGDSFKTYSFGHHKIEEHESIDCLVDLVNNK